MSIRSVLLGLLLGGWICGFTFYNDYVIGQKYFTGHLIPLGLFGVTVFLLLVVNPLIAAVRRSWALRGSELAVITALGLVACSWPATGFFYTFAPNVGAPAHLYKTKPSWQAAGVFSYVPGASPLLAEGYVTKWSRVLADVQAGAADGKPAMRALWSSLPESTRGLAGESLSEPQRASVEKELNRAIENGAFAGETPEESRPERLRRALARVEAHKRQRRALKEKRGELEEKRASVAAEQSEAIERFEKELKRARQRDEELSRKKTELGDQIGRAEGLIRKLAGLAERVGRADRMEPGERAHLLERIRTTLDGDRVDAVDQMRPQRVRAALKEARGRIEDRLEGERESLEEARAARERMEQSLDRNRAELARLNERLRQLRMPIKRLDQRVTRAEKMMVTRAGQVDYAMGVANRAALASAAPSVLAQPRGEGLLLANGRSDPFVTNTLIQGWSSGDLWLPTKLLPWEIWWPTLWLWGGLAILMAVACLCLALIVHPQWSRRELLGYPIARVFQEAFQWPAEGGALPSVARQRMFWYGFGALAAFYLVNGLHDWAPAIFFVEIPKYFPQFAPLSDVFPTLGAQSGAWAVFKPAIFPTVVALAFFLSTDVSLSLGLVGIVWLLFGALLSSQGVSLEQSYMGAKNNNMILLGAWLGFAAMIIYVGRSYYFNVTKSVLPFVRRPSDTPVYARWAARLLAVCVVGSVGLLTTAGLEWGFALVVVLLILLMFVLISRLNAETGAFFIQPYWMPVGALTALLGFESIGPEAYVVMALACVILIGDSREIIMPFVSNGLRIADRPDLGAEPGAGSENAPATAARDRRAQPKWLGPALLVMLLAGFVVALGTTFYFEYNVGVNQQDAFEYPILPSKTFDNLESHVSTLASKGELTDSIRLSGWERVGAIKPDTTMFGWLGLGAALVMGCAVARLRLPWWPLHPAMFLLWGTFGGYRFAWSFFLGWAIKVTLVRLGGAKLYHQVKPMMVGVIAGELMAGVLWLAVGAIYYWITGVAPVGSPVRLL